MTGVQLALADIAPIPGPSSRRGCPRGGYAAAGARPTRSKSRARWCGGPFAWRPSREARADILLLVAALPRGCGGDDSSDGGDAQTIRLRRRFQKLFRNLKSSTSGARRGQDLTVWSNADEPIRAPSRSSSTARPRPSARRRLVRRAWRTKTSSTKPNSTGSFPGFVIQGGDPTGTGNGRHRILDGRSVPSRRRRNTRKASSRWRRARAGRRRHSLAAELFVVTARDLGAGAGLRGARQGRRWSRRRREDRQAGRSHGQRLRPSPS